jgi:hypothetical protein
MTPITEIPSDVTVCIAPFGWVPYIIQPGDTLSSVARATGSTADGLLEANCLQNADRIYVGDVLYVPGVGAQNGSGNQPSAPGAPLTVLGCSDHGTLITSPIAGQQVSDTFILYGTASLPNFWYYKIEVRPDYATEYHFYARSDLSVMNGILGQIDTQFFRSGLHWVRLSVVDLAGVIETSPCVVPLMFE